MDPVELNLTLKNLRTYYLVAGIANSVAFLVGLISVIVAGISTLGCGCLLIFLPLINLTVLIFDFASYVKATQPPSPRIYSFLKLTSIFDMVACFAIVPLIMGILSIQILGRSEVYRYFHEAGVESA